LTKKLVGEERNTIHGTEVLKGGGGVRTGGH